MKKVYLFLVPLVMFAWSCQREQINQFDIMKAVHFEQSQDDSEQSADSVLALANGCKHPTQKQLDQVNQGLKKLNQFLSKCYSETNSKKWCDQVARPNPDSYSIFSCTYSVNQPHYFIHPDESTWKYAVQAVKLVRELEKSGTKIDKIYNWWRPEPYNANVGGAAGRHPLGTSVDVRFVNKTEQNKAHKQLCLYRKEGRLRALGYYSGTGLHLGVGDVNPNTWGKACL